MSVEAVEMVLQRMSDDDSFRRQLQDDPDGTLHGFDIEPWERAAIITGDRGRLEELGVSPELSQLAADYNQTMEQ